MTKQQLIEYAHSTAVMDDALTSFITAHAQHERVEELAILAAFLAGGMKNSWPDESLITMLTQELVDGINITSCDNYSIHPEWSFYGLLTYSHLCNLKRRLIQLKNTPHDGTNGIKARFDCLMQAKRGNRCKYPHEAFALMLGGDTMLPTKNSNGTFYCYNLLYYWLTNKLNLWELPKGDNNALLPCTDVILDTAYKAGITQKPIQPTLNGAIKLTEIAKDWFGEKEFYKLYELLTSLTKRAINNQ